MAHLSNDAHGPLSQIVFQLSLFPCLFCLSVNRGVRGRCDRNHLGCTSADPSATRQSRPVAWTRRGEFSDARKVWKPGSSTTERARLYVAARDFLMIHDRRQNAKESRVRFRNCGNYRQTIARMTAALDGPLIE